MEKTLNSLQRAACGVLAAALMVVSFLFVILGLTFLPVIGILIAAPVMAMALYFLRPDVHVREVEFSASAVYEETETWCSWPRTVQHGFTPIPEKEAA